MNRNEARRLGINRPRVPMYNCPDRKGAEGIWLDRWCIDNGDHIADCYSRSGRLWYAIESRCSKDSAFRALSPWYEGCRNEFTSHQDLAEWCQGQYGYRAKDENGLVWELDKDILIPGNKIYHPDRCCFVPKRINSLLTFNGAARGVLPLGVSYLGGRRKCRARIKDGNNKEIALGYFDDPMDAHRAWQAAKVQIILSAANALASEMHNVAAGLRLHAAAIQQDLDSGVKTTRQ